MESYLVPTVIETTNRGERAFDIYSRMLKERLVFITTPIDDAVASLDLDLSDEEARRLETPYTPRHDFQGIYDSAELERIKASIPGYDNL